MVSLDKNCDDICIVCIVTAFSFVEKSPYKLVTYGKISTHDVTKDVAPWVD